MMRWMGDAVPLDKLAQSGLASAANALKNAAIARVPVDTGRLRASARLEQHGRAATLRFTAGHAVPVHKKRPFLKEALDALDLAAEIARGMRF